MSRSWSGGSTWQYRRFRAAILARDGYACQLRLPGCAGRGTQLHHRLGIAVSGKVCDPEQACAACEPCNQRVGDPAGSTDPRPRVSATRW